MDNQQVTQAELGWLAGIIDGEGWIGFTICNDKRRLRKNNKIVFGVQIAINNTDKAIVDKAASLFRKLGVNPYERVSKPVRKGKTGNRKAYYSIATKHMRKCGRVLSPLLPYLVGNKQERARIMLTFIESRLSQEPQPNPLTGQGRKGSGTIKPYTPEQLEMVTYCRELQRRGTSEAIREEPENSPS